MSAHMSAHMHAHMSAHVSAHMSTHMSIHMSTHLSIQEQMGGLYIEQIGFRMLGRLACVEQMRDRMLSRCGTGMLSRWGTGTHDLLWLHFFVVSLLHVLVHLLVFRVLLSTTKRF